MYILVHSCIENSINAQKSTPKHKNQHQSTKKSINAQKSTSMLNFRHQGTKIDTNVQAWAGGRIIA
jgi:hypothetical protein